MKKIIVLDDEKNITLVIQAMLAREGFDVIVFNDSSQLLKWFADQSVSEEAVQIHAVLTDLFMPGPSGFDVLEYCKKNLPGLPVIMLTAYGTIESAVNALKGGAFDFITKPFDQSELLSIVKKAAAYYEARLKEPVTIERLTEGQVTSGVAPDDFAMIGRAPSIIEIQRVIQKIAATPSTVLIQGESGTGKELVAFEIHRRSDRAHKPFIKVNCAAIPSTLIESELFGYERGAFTGAVSSKLGRFELADEGTLFMDEVAEMPLEMQVKLLRAFQEQEFERVGGVHTVKVNVRIIAATNRNLDAEVKAGRFREDLYYRLNVVPIVLPPLRDRKDDIDALIQAFLVRYNERMKKNILAIEPKCLQAIKNYAWPGNIRQLENLIERMVVLSDENIVKFMDLPEEIRESAKNLPELKADSEDLTFKEIVKNQTQTLERGLIEKALDETQGNVTKASERLGLSRKGLQLKIKELGIRKSSDSTN